MFFLSSRRLRPPRNNDFERRLFKKRLIVAFLFMVMLSLVLLGNLAYLQVICYSKYQTRANDNRIKLVPQAPSRGLIYDRNHIILADNRPLFSLEIVPENSRGLRDDIAALKDLLKLELDDDDIAKILDRSRYQRKFLPVTIAENLNEIQVAVFAVNQYRFPGARIEAKLKRYYPYSETFTHAIGYVARINHDDLTQLEARGKLNNYAATNDIGKQGIEKYYEDLLHGISGYREVEVDSRGREIRTLNLVSPTPGNDITLTIDARLQLKAQHLLHGKRGAIVMMNPRNGEILAMFSSPAYDPNPFVRGIKSREYGALLSNPDRPLINRVTQGGYSPASTVKPLMIIMGLNEDLVNTSTRFFGGPFFQLPGSSHKFRDWRKWGHGWMDIFRAVEISADTFFYDLAFRAGIDRISRYMNQFGMGKSTGIDIYEESLGNMPTKSWKKKRFKRDWVPGDTVSIGIGQGYWTSTLLQLARAHAILTQNGRNVRPHLLQLARDPTGVSPNTFIPPDTAIALPVKDSRYWDYARTGMCLVINGPEGTGRRAFAHTSYSVCGKSGTAQIVGIKQDARYNAGALRETHRDNGLFVAFANKEDPEVLVAVIVENMGGAGKVAAPTARAMLDEYFRIRDTPCGADEIKALKEQYQAEEEQEDLEKMKEKRKN
ncbi:MAG: penicillin-binding protein 2 [Succinimonas sp.]|nr:penicillin-binding protein 2 [Succinimonas sp.]